jgi:hypothetical protein
VSDDPVSLFDGASETRRVAGAILFIQAGTFAMDTYSAVNSSPWTAENFGADAEKASSVREYVTHAIVLTGIYCGASAIIARSYWPIIGGAVLTAYMYWLYDRALQRGSAAGSIGWARRQQ